MAGRPPPAAVGDSFVGPGGRCRLDVGVDLVAARMRQIGVHRVHRGRRVSVRVRVDVREGRAAADHHCCHEQRSGARLTSPPFDQPRANQATSMGAVVALLRRTVAVVPERITPATERPVWKP